MQPLLQTSLRLCKAAQVGLPRPARRACRTSAAKSSKAVNLSWCEPEHLPTVRRCLELAERAADRWEVTLSPFLSPAVLADTLAAIQAPHVVAVAWGGYPQAERCRIAMGREELLMAAQEDPAALGEEAMAALEVAGTFIYDPASHRDFLGACLGTGVVRDRVGDVLVQGEAGAQILCDPELVDHFEAALTKVRTVPVTTRRIPLSELRVPAPRVDEVTSVEASLRLDAVASAGFRMSRSKMGDLIKAGDVRLNWRPATKASAEVKAGDVVSVTGKGRLTVSEVNVTKKDRFAVKMTVNR